LSYNGNGESLPILIFAGLLTKLTQELGESLPFSALLTPRNVKTAYYKADLNNMKKDSPIGEDRGIVVLTL